MVCCSAIAGVLRSIRSLLLPVLPGGNAAAAATTQVVRQAGHLPLGAAASDDLFCMPLVRRSVIGCRPAYSMDQVSAAASPEALGCEAMQQQDRPPAAVLSYVEGFEKQAPPGRLLRCCLVRRPPPSSQLLCLRTALRRVCMMTCTHTELAQARQATCSE